MKWSLFNWKKPVVSSGEPEDYQVVKNTVSQNERNITNINSQITNVNNQLNNTVSTNTAQTITGAKTFNEGITINKTPIPLLLKSTNNNDKTYLVFRDSNNNSNLSIGSRERDTSIEVNRGDLTIQTQQTAKTVSFETGTVKFNTARIEMGTLINAGYGGAAAKFIPEDNSTKTLQFYDRNPGDQRRFNLLVPEPTQANNPATKNYVDNAIAGVSNANLESQINTLNTFKTSVENSLGYNLRYQDISLSNLQQLSRKNYGPFESFNFSVSSIEETKFVSAVLRFRGQSDAETHADEIIMNYSTTFGPKIFFKLLKPTNSILGFPAFAATYIRLFFIENLTTRTQNPYFLVEGDN